MHIQFVNIPFSINVLWALDNEYLSFEIFFNMDRNVSHLIAIGKAFHSQTACTVNVLL